MAMRLSTAINQEQAVKYVQDGLWHNRTLIDSFNDALARNPDKILVIGAGNVRWTYRAVAEKVNALTQHFARLGIGHGDVISAQMPNWAEFILVHLAATRLGAITNPLLPVYRAKELGHILAVAKTKLVMIPCSCRKFNYIELYRELRRGLPDLQNIIVVGQGCPDDMVPFDDLLRPLAAATVEDRQFGGNDVSVLIFTSGTEASPKGVVHTHNTLLFTNLAVARQLELTSDEVIWAVSPITHATGLEWYIRLAIVLGATLVMQEVWDVETALDLIEREKCTITTAATPFAAMLLESPSCEQRDLSSFHTFVCGGAAIPPTLGAMMLEKIGCRVVPCWGMSECFIGTICSKSDPEAKLWGTDGCALPGTEIAIFDEARISQLRQGEVGEIATRGPHVCPGYLNDPSRTASTFSSDGWLFSNDLGLIDTDGYLRVIGRMKDIINRGGLKIAAAEIEELLCRHPSVRLAAVVGVPDRLLGEKSCAFIVPIEGVVPTLDDLVSTLRNFDIAAYKLPEYLVLIEELPMTPTGKVQKFKLRDDFLSGACHNVSGR